MFCLGDYETSKLFVFLLNPLKKLYIKNVQSNKLNWSEICISLTINDRFIKTLIKNKVLLIADFLIPIENHISFAGGNDFR